MMTMMTIKQTTPNRKYDLIYIFVFKLSLFTMLFINTLVNVTGFGFFQ
jgi:hypothetical protein